MADRFLPPIIGLAGRAGAGKDTVAAHLVREYGYVRYSCADPIKDLLNAKFGWAPSYWEDRAWKESVVVTAYGPGQRRIHDTSAELSPRQLAQWLGTEVGRHLAGPDVWINALLVKAAANGHRGCTVIPDIRFDNEARAVQAHGGIVINVWRPAVAAVAEHISERGVDDLYIDYEINNAGTTLETYVKADKILLGWERDFGRKHA